MRTHTRQHRQQRADDRALEGLAAVAFDPARKAYAAHKQQQKSVSLYCQWWWAASSVGCCCCGWQPSPPPPLHPGAAASAVSLQRRWPRSMPSSHQRRPARGHMFIRATAAAATAAAAMAVPSSSCSFAYATRAAFFWPILSSPSSSSTRASSSSSAHSTGPLPLGRRRHHQYRRLCSSVAGASSTSADNGGSSDGDAKGSSRISRGLGVKGGKMPPLPGQAHTVVFVRHGQSDFNRFELFTGWCDVDINDVGEEECRRAGMLLASLGFEFDVAYTSVLKRATKSLWMVLDGCDHTFIPVRMHWRLNERHYGALQGLSKEESEKRMGPIVREWRRSWRAKPPDMDASHPHWGVISNDRRYRDLLDHVPKGESLEMCSVRVMHYWEEEIVPALQEGQRPLVVAHANSLRSLIKKLDGISDEGIEAVKIPNGVPFVYRFDKEMQVLGTPDAVGFRGVFLEEKDVAAEAHRQQTNRVKELFPEVALLESLPDLQDEDGSAEEEGRALSR